MLYFAMGAAMGGGRSLTGHMTGIIRTRAVRPEVLWSAPLVASAKRHIVHHYPKLHFLLHNRSKAAFLGGIQNIMAEWAFGYLINAFSMFSHQKLKRILYRVSIITLVFRHSRVSNNERFDPENVVSQSFPELEGYWRDGRVLLSRFISGEWKIEEMLATMYHYKRQEKRDKRGASQNEKLWLVRKNTGIDTINLLV